MDATNPSAQPTMASRTPLRIGAYALAVRDLDCCVAFYHEIVGLDVMRKSADAASLGVSGVALLHLERRPGAKPDDAGEAGLFHTAFLMPTRRDLADWYLHAQRCGLVITRTGDHDVNEAIYYDDPEGNGCECYADRPPDSWKWADDGTVDIPSTTVDLASLVRDAGAAAGPWRAPGGLRIGHINLRVGDTGRSEEFFCETVGLDHTGRRDVDFGRVGKTITFMSSGRYHHHVATNDFTSRGAGPRDPDRAGLAWFAIEAKDGDALDKVRTRMRAHGGAVTEIDGGFETADPWGTRVKFVTA